MNAPNEVVFLVEAVQMVMVSVVSVSKNLHHFVLLLKGFHNLFISETRTVCLLLKNF
jgi:hypothetical protein